MISSQKCLGGCWYTDTIANNKRCKICGNLKETFNLEFKPHISTAMGVDTKPSHKLEFNGFWILVDGKMPIDKLNELKEKIK
jgi:hypothetical protein